MDCRRSFFRVLEELEEVFWEALSESTGGAEEDRNEGKERLGSTEARWDLLEAMLGKQHDQSSQVFNPGSLPTSLWCCVRADAVQRVRGRAGPGEKEMIVSGRSRA
jgi:hypothetical protein